MHNFSNIPCSLKEVIARCPNCYPSRDVPVEQIKASITLVGVTWGRDLDYINYFPFKPICVWHCGTCNSLFSQTEYNIDSLIESRRADIYSIASALQPVLNIPDERSIDRKIAEVKQEYVAGVRDEFNKVDMSCLRSDIEFLKQKMSYLDGYLDDVRERVKTFILR